MTPYTYDTSSIYKFMTYHYDQLERALDIDNALDAK